MILQAIELTHVGPFRQHTVRVGTFVRGLNIIAAVNESGKSLAMQSAARALFDKHTTRDSEIKALKPAGTDLAPKIAVEFEVGTDRYRIEKTFLMSPRSLLSRWEGGAWQLVAEADAADQRVQALLNSSLPGRGATSPAHWGFLGFLWARQGEAPQWPALDDDTGQKIRHRLARVEIDSVIDDLRNRLATIAEGIITATGNAKTGGPLKLAEDDIEAMDAELVKLRRTDEQIATQHALFNALSAEVAGLEIEYAQRKQRAAELGEQARESERLSVELTKLKTELDTARDRLQTVSSDLDASTKYRSEFDITQEAVAKANAAVVSANESVEDVRLRTDAYQHQLPDFESRLAQRRAERQRNQELLKLLQQRAKAEQIARLDKRMTGAATQLADLQRKRAKLPDITSAKLRRLEELSSSIRELEVQIQALGLKVEITPDADAEVVVSEAGRTHRHMIRKKQTKILQSPRLLNLQIADWGRVLVRSGAKETQDLVSELSDKRDAFQKSLLDFQVATMDAARDAVAMRKDIDAQIRGAESSLTAQLGDYESAEALRKALATAANRVVAMEEQLHPTKAEQTSSATELEANDVKLSAEIKKIEESMNSIGKQLDKLRSEERATVGALQKRTQELNDLGTQQRTLDARIKDLVARYPTGLDTAKVRAQKGFVEAEARFNTIKTKLPPDFEKLPERNRRAAAALQEMAEDLQSKRAARDAAKGALETLGGQGLYSRETDLLERREEAVMRRDAARAKGWAARIAHDLIEFRKQAATKAVLAPLEKRLTAAFADITGDTERQVFLDENLQISGIGRSREEAYAFDQLSQGAKEQLLLCLRLAVAQELVSTESQVLILDDVLVNTDAIRQERVLDVLRNAMTQLQIVIVTCHADRYRGVGQVLSLTPAVSA